MNVRVAVVGASGYTAQESLKLLARHPQAEIVAATSREPAGRKVADVHPALAGAVDLPLENLDAAALANRADVVLSCLPHAASAEWITQALDAGMKLVDLSADYRLLDAETYRTWYGCEHPDADRLGATPYGLPELFREQIRGASLVANPGCYPTSALLPLAPLLREGLIAADEIIIDSKSGVSGAGRTPKLGTLYPECNESISAYAVGAHRHAPEIEQTLQRAAGSEASVIFTPHLTPMDRGILSAIYVRPQPGVDAAAATAALQTAYDGEPFVQIVDEPPATKHVAHTNQCRIAVRQVRGRLVLISVIDNLVKGASGAAVQNMNLLFDLPETMGLN